MYPGLPSGASHLAMRCCTLQELPLFFRCSPGPPRERFLAKARTEATRMWGKAVVVAALCFMLQLPLQSRMRAPPHSTAAEEATSDRKGLISLRLQLYKGLPRISSLKDPR